MIAKAKNIYLFRHPETETPKGICYGNSDVLPNDRQLSQAVADINKWLKDVAFDKIYTSPLSRCTMLAEALSGDKEVIKEELLREIDFGRWEMVSWDKIPDDEREIWGNDYINCKIHGGENFYDVQNRVVEFFGKLTQGSDDTILVVAHAGVYRALLAYLLDASPKKIFAIEIDYGSGILVRWENDKFYKIRFLS